MHTDIVTVNRNNQILVSSREIAAKFGKLHSNVVRDIKNLFHNNKNNSEFLRFFSLNFDEQRISLNNLPRRGRKPEPHYLISRDGFVLLAMGFSGRKALDWKVKFLDAFNQMERTMTEELPRLKARIVELEAETSRKALPGPRKDLVAVPIMQENLFGQVEAINYVMRHKETLDELQKSQARARQMRKILKGMQEKFDALVDRIDLLEGNKKAKLIRMIKDEPEKL